MVSFPHIVERGRRVGRQVGAGRGHHVVDHAGQAHPLAVFRRVDPGYPVFVQLLDFLWHDDAAAAPEHADLGAAALPQHVHHVLEEFHVAALIGADRDTVHVLLQRGGHDFLHGAVVTQVDHFRALPLEDPAHDVDGGVVTVEQAGGGHETEPAGRLRPGLGSNVGGGCGRGHGCDPRVRCAR